jgi:hypothetical protein
MSQQFFGWPYLFFNPFKIPNNKTINYFLINHFKKFVKQNNYEMIKPILRVTQVSINNEVNQI